MSPIKRKRKLFKKFRPRYFQLSYYVKTGDSPWEKRTKDIWYRGCGWPKVTVKDSIADHMYGFQLEHNPKTNEWKQSIQTEYELTLCQKYYEQTNDLRRPRENHQ